MKSLKFIGLALVCLLMAACGPTQKEEELVAQKITEGQQLDEKDYTVVVDYLVKYAQEAQKYQDQINALPADDPKAIAATGELAALTEKYQYVDIYTEALSASTVEGVGPVNVKKVNDNSTLDYFTPPSWAIVDQDPSVAGFIEDMPDTDTSGVISAGDGVVVK